MVLEAGVIIRTMWVFKALTFFIVHKVLKEKLLLYRSEKYVRMAIVVWK